MVIIQTMWSNLCENFNSAILQDILGSCLTESHVFNTEKLVFYMTYVSNQSGQRNTLPTDHPSLTNLSRQSQTYPTSLNLPRFGPNGWKFWVESKRARAQKAQPALHFQN